MTVREHDVVVLRRDLEEHELQKGDVGVVVHVYHGNAGYEVEFMTGSGKTIAVVTLDAQDIRPIGDSEILHAREVSAA